MSARLSGVQLGGGVDTGRTVNDVCFNVDSPGVSAASGAVSLPSIAANPIPFVQSTINGQRICRVVTPFWAQTQFKGFGSYNFPKDFTVSVVYQNISRGRGERPYRLRSTSVVAPSLGRNLRKQAPEIRAPTPPWFR